MEPTVKTKCDFDIYSRELPGPDVFEVGSIFSKARNASVELHDDYLLITAPDFLGQDMDGFRLFFSNVLKAEWSIEPKFGILRQAVLELSYFTDWGESPFRVSDIRLTQTGLFFSELKALHDAVLRDAPSEGSSRHRNMRLWLEEERDWLSRLKVVSPPPRKKRGPRVSLPPITARRSG